MTATVQTSRFPVTDCWQNVHDNISLRLHCVPKTSRTFLAVTRESIVGFS